MTDDLLERLREARRRRARPDRPGRRCGVRRGLAGAYRGRRSRWCGPGRPPRWRPWSGLPRRRRRDRAAGRQHRPRAAGVPDGSGTQVVLSLGRMRRIRDVDPVASTITVEAGVVLADVQAAAAAGRPAVPDVAGLGGQLHHRRQPRDQRRRDRGAALRHDARARPRPGGGAPRRPGVGRAARRCARTTPATTSSTALHRRRGHARHHHRGGAAAASRRPRLARRPGSRSPTSRPRSPCSASLQSHAGARLATFELVNRTGARPGADPPARLARPGARCRLGRPGRAARAATADLDDPLEAALTEAVERGLVARRRRRRQPAQRTALWALREGISEAQKVEGADAQARRHGADRRPRRLDRPHRPDARGDPARRSPGDLRPRRRRQPALQPQRPARSSGRATTTPCAPRPATSRRRSTTPWPPPPGRSAPSTASARPRRRQRRRTSRRWRST